MHLSSDQGTPAPKLRTKAPSTIATILGVAVTARNISKVRKDQQKKEKAVKEKAIRVESIVPDDAQCVREAQHDILHYTQVPDARKLKKPGVLVKGIKMAAAGYVDKEKRAMYTHGNIIYAVTKVKALMRQERYKTQVAWDPVGNLVKRKCSCLNGATDCSHISAFLLALQAEKAGEDHSSIKMSASPKRRTRSSKDFMIWMSRRRDEINYKDTLTARRVKFEDQVQILRNMEHQRRLMLADCLAASCVTL